MNKFATKSNKMKAEVLTKIEMEQEEHTLASVATIHKMQEVSNEFYRKAIQIGNHPFIEFAGLMNEYIKMCTQTWDKGIDFTQAHVHSDQPGLEAHSWNGAYLAEKFSCIFDKTFQDNEEFKEAFIKGMGFDIKPKKKPFSTLLNVVRSKMETDPETQNLVKHGLESKVKMGAK